MYYDQRDKLVALIGLSSSKSITDEFLKKVQNYLRENCHTKKSKNTLKMYGISQSSVTKDYIMVINHTYFEYYCVKCNEKYSNIEYKWCKPCQINDLKKNSTNWSGNKKVDSFIQEMQLNIDNYKSIVFEWIPYNQFNRVNKIDKGGFSTVYSALWVNGPKYYNQNKKENSNKLVALKSLNDSQNIDGFLKEIQYYSREMCHTSNSSNILRVYGMSQNPITKNYIMVFDYANGGNINNYWIKKNYKIFKWKYKIQTLSDIIKGLKEIHQKHMVHCDFHTGNILYDSLHDKVYISDMGLCGEIGNIDNIDETKIYGVMPYVAPEVLRGKPYTQAADIYSFGMIMYFTATGRQPFDNCAHDHHLALDICNGIRPKINEQEAPKCYISLMKKCWDSNPNNRPNAIELEKFINPYKYETEAKFKEAEEYRKKNRLSF
ncbi:kinase-like domain-containing protein, partial [Rhizophagus diaphanus]